MSVPTHILFESASGYALFQHLQSEDIAAQTREVQDSIADLSRFGKMVKLQSFAPFKSAAHALENANDVSEGVVNSYLREFLAINLPTAGSRGGRILLGISDRNLGGSIKGELGYDCDASERSMELMRGIRLHAEKMIPGLEAGDLSKAQLGLGHSYSRGKVKFNVHRSDNMIIQAIALLDQLDKDVNTFSMRVREWYGWHFPELIKIVPDNYTYAKLAKLIKDKSKLTDKDVEKIAQILPVDDADLGQAILDASRSSMGTDISPVDMINIEAFADRVISLAEYRKSLHAYLIDKMNLVAPNLSSLIGETVGARLISHAGSLTNLCKYPASTLQILGAEKALFRALKTKSNTPKYGLIYHSTFIGRAATKNKGRISRFLANKCSIASRIDCFADLPTTKFGEALRGQVEDRLKFYEQGANPKKNADVMAAVVQMIKEAAEEGQEIVDEKELAEEEDAIAEAEQVARSEAKLEKKKKKKSKVSVPETSEMEIDSREDDAVDKKKKRKKRKSEVALQDGDHAATIEASAKTLETPERNAGTSADLPSSGSNKKKKRSELPEGGVALPDPRTPTASEKIQDVKSATKEAEILGSSKSEKSDKKKKKKRESLV